MKLGLGNLAKLLEIETDQNMQQGLLGALNGFLSGNNFNGKREFVKDFEGLSIVTQKYVQADSSMKLKWRVMTLL
jgi:hypothetical protein